MKCRGWRTSPCDREATHIIRFHWEGAEWFPTVANLCSRCFIDSNTFLFNGPSWRQASDYRWSAAAEAPGESAPFVNDHYCMRCGLHEQRCQCLPPSSSRRSKTRPD